MRKILFLIMLVIFVMGCSGTGGGKNPIENLYTGTSGITMKFERGSPPSEVYENEKFVISTNVANKGAFDVEDAYVTLGIEPEYMAVEDWMSSKTQLGEYSSMAIISLEGKSEVNPEGDFDLFTIKLQAGNLEQQTEVHTTSIYLSVCYPYKTFLSETICVDTDIYGTRQDDKACSAKEGYSFSSQGAPVAVTKADIQMMPGQDKDTVIPEVTIHIKNKGNGEVLRTRNFAEFCTSSTIDRTDINQVGIRAKLSGETLKCRSDVIKLGKTDDYVICRLEQGLTTKLSAYPASLTVELDYGYTFTESKQVKIRRLV